MPNLTHPELAEIHNDSLPPASLENLQALRGDLCRSTEFSLQSHQKFLRRVLSPDSATRDLLMVHGTGVGKTCSAIQIAEEYIMRPEFQDKKVLVIAGPAVQSNFRTEIFDLQRIKLDEKSQILSSKQCTGRRYLEMLQRVISEPRQWFVPETRARLMTLADRIIDEFYEFSGYHSFGARINEKLAELSPEDADKWIHETFDNRLILVDEAHNLREGGEGSDKSVSTGIEKLVKTADGVILVLMTATPMYESYEEIVFFMNLFLWNDRKQKTTKKLKSSDYFTSDGNVKPAMESKFREWCQEYVSFVKGENPFTFPFRLPAPNAAPDDRTHSFVGKSKRIGDDERLKYLKVVASQVRGDQGKAVGETPAADEKDEEKRAALMLTTVSVLPDNKKFREVFRSSGDQYEYVGEPFLTPEALPNHAVKFATIIKSIEASKGVVMVYSNYVEQGARLFAMALEEHGYRPAAGNPLLAGDRPKGKGAYILLSSEVSTPQTNTLLRMARDQRNADGSLVRVIVTTPRISEGVNFRFVRQIHIIDPWWNMSRMEQVIGRGLRTCSHASLPFEDQNCTVYLHVCHTTARRECFDEYTYRTKVEAKAIKIANVRRILSESAMDCPVQMGMNRLPLEWKNLEVPQTRSEGAEPVLFSLHSMLAPQFMQDLDATECRIQPSVEDPNYVRPLSSYLDVRDEILNKLSKLFLDKAIWERKQLFAAVGMYDDDVIGYTLQNAVRTGFKFQDAFGRPSLLESKGSLYALAPIGVPNSTAIERVSSVRERKDVVLPEIVETPKTPVSDAPDLVALRDFPFNVERFSDDVLNGYVFDHKLTVAQKVLYLRSGQPLPYGERLKVPGTDILVLGHEVYDPADVPPGEPLTAVTKWTDDLLHHFDENKTRIFASVRNEKLAISRFKMDGETPIREVGKKRDVPIVCGTGENKQPAVLALAKYVDPAGLGVPQELTKLNRDNWCTYTELLLRSNTDDKIVWYTPEEMETIISAKPKTKKSK